MFRRLCRAVRELFFKRKKMPSAGYIYAPYVPLQVTRILNPSDFKPRKGILMKYSTKTIQKSYYGTVTVSDLGKETK